MGIKDTKIWQIARKLRDKRAFVAHYKKALKMPLDEYEEYLKERHIKFIDREPHAKGERLDFANPQTFTQKCQWIKLYDQDPRKSVYSDKYAVREHIKETIGEEYLVPLLTIDGKDHFYNANEIDFEKLPNKFVLKCNHGSHMNILVEDKSLLTKKQIKNYKKQLNKWLKINYVYYVALETQYLGIKPCIIIEKFLEPNTEMREFKFTYFNGELAFYWISERIVYDSRTTTSFLPNGELAPFNFDLGINKPVDDPSIPSEIDQMLQIANKLAEDFTMVRVDLALLNGKIYFSELTFNSAAGYDAPRPIEYNKIIGDQLKLDLSVRERITKYRKL